MAEKVSFLNLQKKLLYKEHQLKMKILGYEYLIKKKRAESLGLTLDKSELFSEDSDLSD